MEFSRENVEVPTRKKKSIPCLRSKKKKKKFVDEDKKVTIVLIIIGNHLKIFKEPCEIIRKIRNP